LLQVLPPEWDKPCSESSEGFRPERSAHQAGAQAQRCLGKGDGWVVDRDLELCVDRGNHDQRRSLAKQRVMDRRGLQRIDRDLKAGALEAAPRLAAGEALVERLESTRSRAKRRRRRSLLPGHAGGPGRQARGRGPDRDDGVHGHAHHPPPHFHVRYAGQRALMGIATLGVLQGQLSPRVLGLVVEWAAQHQAELAATWDLAVRQQPLQPIQPLE
jgi:Domain of unknown function (DUF4160)